MNNSSLCSKKKPHDKITSIIQSASRSISLHYRYLAVYKMSAMFLVYAYRLFASTVPYHRSIAYCKCVHCLNNYIMSQVKHPHFLLTT